MLRHAGLLSMLFYKRKAWRAPLLLPHHAYACWGKALGCTPGKLAAVILLGPAFRLLGRTLHKPKRPGPVVSVVESVLVTPDGFHD